MLAARILGLKENRRKVKPDITQLNDPEPAI
jgi:hypothetical protein